MKNITEKEIFEFEEKGIKNKDKIVFTSDNVKYNIKYNDDIMMIREGEDFINTFIFKNKNSTSNYLLKENGYDMDLEINTKKKDISTNTIYIEYEIVSTGCIYEFKLEMSEIL